MTTPDRRTAPVAPAREPKYYGLKTYLLDLASTRPPGTPVPSERILAEEFATSRTTVRQALQELVVEGRLRRLQGKGTFVAAPKIAQPLVLTSYTDDAHRRGATPGSRLLGVERRAADDAVARLLGVGAGTGLVVVQRLRLSDGEPMAVEHSHLVAARVPDLDRHLGDGVSLYAVLREHYGLTPAAADQTIETGAASPAEAALLGGETGLPVLLLGRCTFGDDGTAFEYVRSLYRGDRYKLVARLTPPVAR